MSPKRWYTSKTLWVNTIAAIAMIVQSRTEFVISPEDQAALLVLVNIILRFVTRSAITLVLVSAVLLSGCVGPVGFAGMDVDQIQALAKIKDAAVICARYDGTVRAQARLTIASVDKGVEGQMAVSPDCAVMIDTKREAK